MYETFSQSMCVYVPIIFSLDARNGKWNVLHKDFVFFISANVKWFISAGYLYVGISISHSTGFGFGILEFNASISFATVQINIKLWKYRKTLVIKSIFDGLDVVRQWGTVKLLVSDVKKTLISVSENMCILVSSVIILFMKLRSIKALV